MPYALRYIPDWNALEIRTNGKNTPVTNSRFLEFVNNLPQKKKLDDFTYLIPKTDLPAYMKQFGMITTMTQTVASILGTEQTIFPDIEYELKHLDSLKLKPYPFQQLGISFLVSEKRAIIGDEMGLGKTISGLGAAHELLEDGTIKKVLVICPASLKYQWESEIAKFSDHTCLVVDGTKVKRKKIYDHFATSDIPFLVLNYETVRGDIDLLTTLDFQCIICDEAHRLKSRTTQIYKAFIQLQPEYRFALTGTPMQNRPDEVFALMSWIDEDVLGKVTAFRKNHIVTGEKFGRRFIDLGYKNLDDIRDKIAPKLLRRTKEEVAPDLPEMLFTIGYATMTKPQQELYDAVSEDFKILQLEIQDFYQTQTEADARKGIRYEKEDKVLGYMYMMQAISNHPMLLAQGKSTIAKKYMPLIRQCRTSPKLEEMMELMTPLIESGKKVIVFSQYAQMLQLIKARIISQFNQEPYMIYGAIPGKERQKQIEAFRDTSQRQIMLLSDAGNYGLNLQFVDNQFNYELPWNPAVLAQRRGRIHRIGSSFSVVNFVDMVTLGTIDEQIMKTLERKEALNEGLIEKTKDEKDWMKEMLDKI